jgi:hypothetical protein
MIPAQSPRLAHLALAPNWVDPWHLFVLLVLLGGVTHQEVISPEPPEDFPLLPHGHAGLTPVPHAAHVRTEHGGARMSPA